VEGSFIRNSWYAAAWSEEVTPALLERWILGEPLVFFRTRDGRAVAVNGTCPHRRYPLARGTLVDDAVVCGYHGLTFGSAGACVRAPGAERVQAAMRVNAYKLCERGGLIWIWPGDPELADETTIVDRWLTEPSWRAVHDTLVVNARQSLMIDNLMDLTHEQWLHPGTLAHDSLSETSLVTEVADGAVRSSRTMHNVPPPGLFAKVGVEGPIDRGQIAEFHPSGLCLTVVTATPRSTPEKTVHWTVMHCLTPETASRTRYLWATARDFALDDPAVDATWISQTNAIFQQDATALEALELRTQALPDAPELSLPNDAGGLAARKMLRERRRRETLVAQ
jgi:phenylpropionate dioxygenase-like ring-hydroxylating dioxygenase large terminal subunit